MQTRRSIHVLFEHGDDRQPFGSAQIRLLRPLFYPAVADRLRVTADTDYLGQAVDGVVIDRLWKPGFASTEARELVAKIRRAGARLIYALDDNFLDMGLEDRDWKSTEERRWIVRYLLRQADGIMVPTEFLRQRLLGFNPNVVVVPHAVDERLLGGDPSVRTTGELPGVPGSEIPRRSKGGGGFPSGGSRVDPEWVTIGYMGTFTHDDDFAMVLPALQAVADRYGDRVQIQILGVLSRAEKTDALGGLKAKVIVPPVHKAQYPEFMRWFTGEFRWDIAISPLRESAFNQCKSDIKFLDYCALGAAGVYSRVPAYLSTVKHLETGWLAENSVDAWLAALTQLIDDAGLRNSIGRNAARYLREHRILARRWMDWPEAFATLERGSG